MTRATRPIGTAVRRTVDRLRRASRYDLVLAVIPAAFILAALAGTSPSVPARTAVAAAAVVGGIAMFDGLFLNPPRRPRVGRRSGR